MYNNNYLLFNNTLHIISLYLMKFSKLPHDINRFDPLHYLYKVCI